MAIKKERGLRELYQDPHHADAVLWSRRRVLQGAGAMTLARTLGAAIPYLRYLPAGIAPVALAQSSEVVLDLPGLRVLR
jgi:hypothetical protein